MSEANVVSSLVVNILADTRKFDKRMKTSSLKVRTFGQVASDTGQNIARALSSASGVSVAAMGSIATAAGVAAVAVGGLATAYFRFYSSMADRRDLLTKEAQSLGISAQALEQYRVAAAFAGIENSKLTDGLRTMSQRVGEAGMGMGEAQRVLERLGYSARSLEALGVGGMFWELGNSISRVGDESERLALFQKMFGEQAGFGMARMFNDNAEAFRQMLDHMAAYGSTSDKSFKNAEKFKDELFRLGDGITRIGETILDAFGDELITSLRAVNSMLRTLSAGAFAIKAMVGLAKSGTLAENTTTGKSLTSNAGMVGSALKGTLPGTAGAAVEAGTAVVKQFIQLGVKETERIERAKQENNRPMNVVMGGNR